MIKKTILIVDDDTNILRLVTHALKENGYNVLSTNLGQEALYLLEEKSIDAIILDVLLPDIDGLQILKIVRNHHYHHHIPVLMLTCKDSEIDSVLGFEMGADDYITKPIRYHELMARVKRIFRRTDVNSSYGLKKILLNDLTIDLSTRCVLLKNQTLHLSFKEFELLSLLAKKPGKVFTRDEILNVVWQESYNLETRTVDVHIRRIRKKLEKITPTTIAIETIRNVGYRLLIL